MVSIQQIAEQLRDYLIADFPYIRISGGTTPEQLAKELMSIPEHSLPALIIIADSAVYSQDGLNRELTLGVVLIDRFTANPDNRTVSAWSAMETLQDLFTVHGTAIGDAVYIPQRFDAFRADVNHAGYTLELKVMHAI